MIDIHLINPPSNWSGVEYSKGMPNHSIFSLASYINNKNPNFIIKISDGNILNLNQILADISGDTKYFGISTFCFNYTNALTIYEYIINIAPDAKIVFGGSIASTLYNVIMKKRKKVDIIVKGEGEIALYDIIRGKALNEIENLVYRHDGVIYENESVEHDINEITTIINYNKFVNLDDKYFSNYTKMVNCGQREKKKLPIYFTKGCAYALKKGKRCLFCSIMNKSFRKRNVKDVWKEIMFYSSLGAEEIIDASDNILDDVDYANEILSQKPAEAKIKFKFYSSAKSLTEKTASMLKKIGCSGLLIGMESASDIILTKYMKESKLKDNIRAVKLLRQYDILPRITLVLGGIGETIDTAKETLSFAKEHFHEGDWVSSSILKPLKGSLSFELLMKHPDLAKKYENTDNLDYNELSMDWVKKYCKASYDELEKINDEILKISSLNSTWK